jgi:glycosyltransferase involved in cell wall biosynthesis
MGNFDLLIANTILMWPSVLAAKERHLAAIWMIHESQAGKEIALSEKGAQKAFQIADMLIFGCRSNQDLYRGLQHGTNFRTIHYGTEGLRISDDVSDQNFNEQKFTILHIGSIETRKGQDVLIEAVKGLSKEYRDKIQVFLIGRKLNNPFFEKMQRLLKGSSNIEWLGELPHKEVAILMYRAQLFVCSSRDEVFPLTILEAMSAGKPVIAADVGGVREMITDGVDGFIVPNGDFQSLREKIEYCIKNPAVLQKVGGNARERFLKEFSLNKFGNRFLSILEKFVK